MKKEEIELRTCPCCGGSGNEVVEDTIGCEYTWICDYCSGKGKIKMVKTWIPIKMAKTLFHKERRIIRAQI